ncbi:hypothetical protein PTTG_29433 [Puccinia triticina 1-1 BBBD Race 1]|uniref:DUF7143 domain-containing protein n=2 Tax=Puccinia triticina TaxID=208348 RepID=A0A180G421_PUCT1|nr:uncharacterized protein PtA15_6A837 [Puccinia triticina]OAV87436.1 hypothetical protein PTTG_29433 [Puccinia triticina 1-1 BBBD Race 1]WAQ86205.1 hypothetical protein PtA15_6A837 [Puccinia triticina]WAR56093.1 hypothetical protein PtB15_6B838 [Puccinia triticina]
MKSRFNVQVSVLLLAGSFLKVLAQTTPPPPCFITGPNFPLPRTIVYDEKAVQCDTTIKLATPLLNIPDIYIQVGTQKFSFSSKDIGFHTSNLPSTIFALKTFGVVPKEKEAVLDIYGKLYGAMNAAVRSNNYKDAIQMVKGAQNFLNLHIRVLAGDSSSEKLTEMFTKVTRLCIKCTAKDYQDLNAYAVAKKIRIEP